MDECSYCNGSFCYKHGTNRCKCDTEERHGKDECPRLRNLPQGGSGTAAAFDATLADRLAAMRSEWVNGLAQKVVADLRRYLEAEYQFDSAKQLHTLMAVVLHQAAANVILT